MTPPDPAVVERLAGRMARVCSGPNALPLDGMRAVAADVLNHYIEKSAVEKLVEDMSKLTEELSKIHNMNRVEREKEGLPSWSEAPRNLHDAYHTAQFALSAYRKAAGDGR